MVKDFHPVGEFLKIPAMVPRGSRQLSCQQFAAGLILGFRVALDLQLEPRVVAAFSMGIPLGVIPRLDKGSGQENASCYACCVLGPVDWYWSYAELRLCMMMRASSGLLLRGLR